MNKLTKKLQVLLSEEEVTIINRIILNEAVKNNERPISISAFIRKTIRREIDQKADELKTWDKNNVKKLKNK